MADFETRVCGAEDLPFGDATFDSISGTVRIPSFPTSPKRPPSSGVSASVLVGMGRARNLIGRRSAMQAITAEGGAGATRRAGYVPVRCPGICQRPVRGRRGCAALPSGTSASSL